MALTLLLKSPLPAVQQNADRLTKQLFVLLKDYSKAGAARGENHLLVQNCFKVRRGAASRPGCPFEPKRGAILTLTEPSRRRSQGHQHSCEERQKQQDFGGTVAGAPGLR